MFNFKIINFIDNSNDKFSEITEIIKILKKFFCRNILRVKTFSTVYVYYRI